MNTELLKILNKIEEGIHELEEEMSYTEIAGQWRETVPAFSQATALLKQFYTAHLTWLNSLEQA